jgi:hypothetical protein
VVVAVATEADTFASDFESSDDESAAAATRFEAATKLLLAKSNAAEVGTPATLPVTESLSSSSFAEEEKKEATSPPAAAPEGFEGPS